MLVLAHPSSNACKWAYVSMALQYCQQKEMIVLNWAIIMIDVHDII
jgi:hypothetical protein